MSKLSIFDKQWIDLVFEGKNQQYGAYQLRQENSKTSVLAFIAGLLFIVSLSALMLLLSSFGPKPIIENPIVNPITPVHLSDINPPENELPKPNVVPLKKEDPKKEFKSKDLIHPKIVKATENPDDLTKNVDLNKSATTPENGNSSGTAIITSNATSGGGTATLPASIIPDNTPTVASLLDKMPVFPGGIDKFRQYIGNNFEKPEVDIDKTITLIVSFVIERDGAMSEIKVLRDPGYGLAKEAIRVFKSLKTKWEPGILDGQKVRTAYSLPIAIKIE